MIGSLAILLTALASLIVAIVAMRQLSFNRFALGVETVLKLDERFEKEFVPKRIAAAIALKNLTEVNKPEIEPILDFFETVGLLARRKAIDEELVWSTFFYRFYGYYRLCKEIIDKQRSNGQVQDLLWLKDVLIDFEKRKRGRLDESEWDNFLEEETQLKA